MTSAALLAVAAGLAAGAWSRTAPAPAPPPQAPQQSEVILSISGETGARPRYAVPDFIARASDAETQAAAKLMGSVLWDDLAFEREFYMVPRDTYRTIPAARSFAEVPFDRWRELGVDGLVMGSVERTAPGTWRVEVRLLDVRSRRSVMAKEYTGRPRTRGCTPTRPPTTSTSSSGPCAAPPARSSRSRRTATASAWRTRSRRGT